MKKVLSPSNIIAPPKIIKKDDSEMDAMRKITNDHLNALKAHQEESRRIKEDTSEKRSNEGVRLQQHNYTPARSKNENRWYKGRAKK